VRMTRRIDGHLHERMELQAEACRIDFRAIGGDDLVALERIHARPAGRLREADLLREGVERQAAVALHQAENGLVDPVYHGTCVLRGVGELELAFFASGRKQNRLYTWRTMSTDDLQRRDRASLLHP